MKLLFLVLVLWCSIIKICYSIECQSLPTGLDRLSHGIDITSFDLFPTDLTEANGFGRNIFDFTCDKHKKWTHPYVPGLVFDLPDQIESITPITGGIVDTQVEVSHTTQEVKENQAKTVHHSFLLGMFSSTKSYSHIVETITEHSKVVTKVTGFVSAYEVKLAANQTAGLYVKGFFDNLLPNTYQENPAKYQEFLDTFGTNYFSNARFGGLMKVDIETETTYVSKLTADDFKKKAGIAFMNILSKSGGHENIAMDQSFKQNSVIHESYYGGSADLINQGTDGFQKWWDSAKRVPWIFSGTLESLTDLLPNGPKKNAINIAIAVKLDYAYLDELLLTLNILKRNPKINVAMANNYVNQIHALRVQPIPAHASVAQLGATVEQFVGVQKLIKP